MPNLLNLLSSSLETKNQPNIQDMPSAKNYIKLNVMRGVKVT